MAEETKSGSIWRDDELDAIVTDYFTMLEADLSGRPYVKSKHSRTLMAQIGRSHRSVEFKHQNISAVLAKLGMAWIPGYKPKSNYQKAILDAIERYLTLHPAILEHVPAHSAATGSAAGAFVRTPTTATDVEPIPNRLRRLVRKFDPLERDYRNRALG